MRTSRPVLRSELTKVSCMEMRRMPQSRISGWTWPSWTEMAFISAWACAMETPGLRRAKVVLTWLRRILVGRIDDERRVEVAAAEEIERGGRDADDGGGLAVEA